MPHDLTPIAARRLYLFRAAALVLGLLPFFLLELVLAIGGIGQINHQLDPFVGFDGQRPLFVLSDDNQRYEIAKGRELCFRPDSFAARKDPDEYRVFCLGGSTVQGRPYAIETSFTSWFELSLQSAAEERQFDLINCGGISYASYRLVPILQEILQYQPDLIVLYTGHNEFLEDRTYQGIKQRSPVTNRVLRQATRLRTFRWFWSRWNDRKTQAARKTPSQLPIEVEARLDYEGGLSLYHRDPGWRDDIVRHFEYNLRRMVALCQEAEVPIWIVDPVCNLRSIPPFKSEHRSDLTPDQLAQVQRLRDEARSLYSTDLNQAVVLLEEAATIDDAHAGLAYDLAKCYEATEQFDKARLAYLRAKEEDVCPLRIIEPLRQTLRSVAQQTGSPLIEVCRLFEDNSRHGIPGGFLLVDHVHPSIVGHQMIAELMMQQAIADNIVQVGDGWSTRRDEAYARHMSTLDDQYYLEGQRRLEGLRKWAAGRATGAKPTSE